jgi:hypothetical protein
VVSATLTGLWLRPQGPASEVEIVKGTQVLVTVDPAFRTRGNANTVWVDYPNIIRVVAVGGRIYIDDGLISLVVQKIGADAPPALTTPSTGHVLFPLVSPFAFRPTTPFPGHAYFLSRPRSPQHLDSCPHHGLGLDFAEVHLVPPLSVGGRGTQNKGGELRRTWFS